MEPEAPSGYYVHIYSYIKQAEPLAIATDLFTNLSPDIQPFIGRYGDASYVPLRYYEKVRLPSSWMSSIVRGNPEVTVAELTNATQRINRNIETGAVTHTTDLYNQIQFLEDATSSLYNLAVTSVSGVVSSLLPVIGTTTYDLASTILYTDIMPRDQDSVNDWAVRINLPRLFQEGSTTLYQFNTTGGDVATSLLGSLWLQLWPRE